MPKMEKKPKQPNPAGREGKPFSLAPHSFDEALKKILTASPPPKPESKKPAKKVSRKK